MPRRASSRAKRPRSPPRRRVEDGADRAGEETATDDENVEQRTKLRHDPLHAPRNSRDKAAARTPPKRRRRVVAISSGEEEEPLSPRGEDDDLQHDFWYGPKPVLGRLICYVGRHRKRVSCFSECLSEHVDVFPDRTLPNPGDSGRLVA